VSVRNIIAYTWIFIAKVQNLLNESELYCKQMLNCQPND